MTDVVRTTATVAAKRLAGAPSTSTRTRLKGYCPDGQRCALGAPCSQLCLRLERREIEQRRQDAIAASRQERRSAAKPARTVIHPPADAVEEPGMFQHVSAHGTEAEPE